MIAPLIYDEGEYCEFSSTIHQTDMIDTSNKSGGEPKSTQDVLSNTGLALGPDLPASISITPTE